MAESGQRKRITIIGLGLIGGSLGLAIKASGSLSDVEIVGHDRERSAEDTAKRMGAIDRAEHNLPRAVEGAGMVIIATPLLAIREVLQQIAEDLSEGCIVTETGSTKESVMEWAAALLPTTVSFVGGHPMAGKEAQGIENADAELFKGRAYCICPSVDASETAVRSVVGLAQLVGAEPLFLEPHEHDRYAAAVSHLPLLVSTALFTLLRDSPAWNDLAPMASSGFRDLTRLASGDPRMSHDIFLTNREAALHWLDRMMDELRRFRDLLEGDAEALMETFGRAQIDRDEFIARPPSRRTPTAERGDPNVRQELMSAFIGGWMADRLKRARELPAVLRKADAAEKRPSRGERMAEDIRRDIEKLEQKRKDKE